MRKLDELMIRKMCLKMFKTEFFHRFVTTDETWLHHFTPRSRSKASKNATVGWQGDGVYILKCAWNDFH